MFWKISIQKKLRAEPALARHTKKCIPFLMIPTERRGWSESKPLPAFWVVTHFVLPRSIIEGLGVLARGVADRERADRRNAPRGRRRRYPRTRNFYVTEALNALLADYGLSQFCVDEEDEESSPRRVRRFIVSE